MFHVSHMIPLHDIDPSRKRHLGNDIVLMIFKEDPQDTFDPAHFESHFNHIFVVVEKVTPTSKDAMTKYKIEVVTKPDVPPFPPYLPSPPIIEQENLRDYLLTKLINGERTAMLHTPIFSNKMQRTRSELLKNLVEPYAKKKK